MFYILIGYNVRNLYQSISVGVEIVEIIYMHSIRLFLFEGSKNIQWTNVTLLPMHEVL